jgi:hypothetical protein
MARDIASKGMSCISCDETAPSQSPEPPITPTTPECPFQQIGGPEYTAGNTREFLRKLGVHHRLTSVGFPHAIQKAERSVGTAKTVIGDAVKPNGELDTFTLVRGLLTLRNTPDQDTGLSTVQMLLGRDLQDFLLDNLAAGSF